MKNKSLTIALDLDGVLVDFESKFVNWPASNNFDFWYTLPWLNEGPATLQYLEEHFENIFICSSPSNSEHSASGKMKWIQKNIPQYARKFAICPCKHMLAGPNKLLIDDYGKNVKSFIEHGGRSIKFENLDKLKEDVCLLLHSVTDQA